MGLFENGVYTPKIAIQWVNMMNRDEPICLGYFIFRQTQTTYSKYWFIPSMIHSGELINQYVFYIVLLPMGSLCQLFSCAG